MPAKNRTTPAAGLDGRTLDGDLIKRGGRRRISYRYSVSIEQETEDETRTWGMGFTRPGKGTWLWVFKGTFKETAAIRSFMNAVSIDFSRRGRPEREHWIALHYMARRSRILTRSSLRERRGVELPRSLANLEDRTCAAILSKDLKIADRRLVLKVIRRARAAVSDSLKRLQRVVNARRQSPGRTSDQSIT